MELKLMMFGATASASRTITFGIVSSNLYQSATSTSSHSITLPSYEIGDLLVVAFTGLSNANYTYDTPSGWTAGTGSVVNSSSLGFKLYYKVATGTETSFDWGIRLNGTLTNEFSSAAAFTVRGANTAVFKWRSGLYEPLYFDGHTATSGAPQYLWLRYYAQRGVAGTVCGIPASVNPGYTGWTYLTTETLNQHAVGWASKISTSNVETYFSTQVSGPESYPLTAAIAVFTAP